MSASRAKGMQGLADIRDEWNDAARNPAPILTNKEILPCLMKGFFIARMICG